MGEPSAQAGYHVFTVGDKPRRDSPKSLSVSSSETKEYKHRRFHTKSTLGCLTCKARRIKVRGSRGDLPLFSRIVKRGP